MTVPLTFLFTDLANSTHLWEQFPEAMRPAMARHDALLKQVVENHHGRIVKTTGDGLHAVFESPLDGVNAALAGQQALTSATWPTEIGPFNVRMGLHTGESQERDGDYYGPEVNLAARVMGLAHGGQVLLSASTAALGKKTLPPGCTLADLGEHRLKGIAAPEHLFQLCHPDLVAEFPPLQSLATFKHNLHRSLTTFIGREKELAEVKRLLQATQLLTLLGPGGTGKTRLMLQVAEEVIAGYSEGVWLVELAPLTNPDLIAERVAAALNVQEQPGRQMLATLTEYLRRKELLLLLDNVEHLVRECATIAEHLLEHCPRLKILVTGREALFIGGETTLQIPSLSLPEDHGNVTLEAAHASEGVQLFLERAHAVRPKFALTPHNAPAIVEIVRRLDGIPLALELAAARLRMLTVEQIASRLNDRFRLLTGGRRTALPRQQTLQALIDWSWNLLEEPERVLLRRLSVFSGGWTLEAAQTVTGFDPLDEFAVFDGLEQLINKSLVTVQYPPEGEARYGMLESIRQYAQGKLFETGEGENLRNRHTEYFVAFAVESEYHLIRDTMVSRVNRILLELDNLRAVLAWTLEDRPALALRISSSLLYHWAHWIHPSEARSWLESSIEKSRSLLESEPSDTLIQDFIKAHIGLGVGYSLFGDNDGGIAIIDQGVALAREYSELAYMTFGIAWKMNLMILSQYEFTPEWQKELDLALEISEQNGLELSQGMLHLIMFFILTNQGKSTEALPHFQIMVGLAQKLNNPRVNANLLQIQARVSAAQGDPETAKQLYLKAIDDYIAINDFRGALHSKSEVAHILRREGDLEGALRLYRETIQKWQEEGSIPALAHQLECFAYIAIARGQPKPAARLLGRAQATREAQNAPSTDPVEIAELEQALEQLAEAMSAAERDRAMASGKRMSLDDAVLFALKEIP